jgi:hypothetical protein
LTPPLAIAFCGVALLGFAAGWLAKPTGDRWHFDTAYGAYDAKFVIRVDRRTGETELFIPFSGWRPQPATPIPNPVLPTLPPRQNPE